MRELFRANRRTPLRIPDLSSLSFTFDLHALDGLSSRWHFRLLGWSTTEDGRCKGVSMAYFSPSETDPVKVVSVEQLDLAAARIGFALDSEEERQEKMLSRHQELYAQQSREQWFLHSEKQVSVLAGAPAVLDVWLGRQRTYWICQAFVGQVLLQVLCSGCDRSEALTLMKRLVPITSVPGLIDRHT